MLNLNDKLLSFKFHSTITSSKEQQKCHQYLNFISSNFRGEELFLI